MGIRRKRRFRREEEELFGKCESPISICPIKDGGLADSCQQHKKSGSSPRCGDMPRGDV